MKITFFHFFQMEIVAEAEKDPQVETKKAKRRKLRGEVQDCIVFHENILRSAFSLL